MYINTYIFKCKFLNVIYTLNVSSTISFFFFPDQLDFHITNRFHFASKNPVLQNAQLQILYQQNIAVLLINTYLYEIRLYYQQIHNDDLQTVNFVDMF